MWGNNVKVVFRTHGGKDIGLGHLSRCIALAHAMRQEANIVFVVNKEASEYVKNRGLNVKISDFFGKKDIIDIKELRPDLVILDSYEATLEYINALRNISRVAIFDDNGEHNPVVAHYVINGNAHADEVKYEHVYSDTSFLLGPEYLVMNPDYWNVSEKSAFEGEGVLISAGGADIYCLMPKFMNALKCLSMPKRVIIGPFYPRDEIEYIERIDGNFELVCAPDSLKSHIEKSKLIITAAGSTVYEALTLGKIPVIYTIADNQLLIENKLKKWGITSLGYYKEIEWNNLAKMVEEKYNEDFALPQEIPNVFDGKGVFRLKKELLKKV